MKKITQRFLGFLLTLTMVIAMILAFSIVASAETTVTLYVDSTTADDTAIRAEQATYKTIAGALAKAESGDTIKLMSNVIENVTINTGKEIVLDLNNHVLSGTGIGSVITVKGTLTLDDTSTDKLGNVTSGSATSYGGGVYIDNNANFTMNGGTISSNIAGTYGGGVYICSGSSFTINGGIISTNSAVQGGGVYTQNEFSTVSLMGGTITGNSDTDGTYHFGGVLLNANGGKKYTVGGNIKIYGNTSSNGASNLVLWDVSEPALVVDNNNSLQGDAVIHISQYAKGYHTKTTIGAITTDSSADYSSFFVSNESDYVVVDKKDNSNHSLSLIVYPTFDDRFGGKYSFYGTEAEYTSYGALSVGTEYPVHDTTKYTFAGWYTGIDGTGTKLEDAPESGAKYYAKWTKNGVTVRTETLDISNLDGAHTMGSVKEGEVFTNTAQGWKWDRSTSGDTAKTLIIDGIIIDTQNDYGLKLPDGVSVVVSGACIINSTGHGINAVGDVTITGSSVETDVLTIKVSENTSYGIVANGGCLKINKVQVNVSAGTNALVSTCINNTQENILIDNATVNVSLKTTTNGDVIYTGIGKIGIYNSSVDVKNGSYGIHAEGIEISESHVIVNDSAEKGFWADADSAKIEIISISNVEVNGCAEGMRAGTETSAGSISIGASILKIGETTEIGKVGVWANGSVCISNESVVSVKVGTDPMAKGIYCENNNITINDNSVVNVFINGSVNKGIDQGDKNSPSDTDSHQYAICAANGNVVIGDINAASVTVRGGAIGIIANSDDTEDGKIIINSGTVDVNSGLTALWSKNDTTISGGIINVTASNTESSASTSSKAIYSYSGKIGIMNGAIVIASASSISQDSYGIRTKAKNVGIFGDDTVVTANGSTSAYSIGGTLTAPNAIILAGENLAKSTVQSGDAKTVATGNKYARVSFGSIFDNRFGEKYTTSSALQVGSVYTVHDTTKYTFAGWYTGIDGTGTKLEDAPESGTTYYAKWTKNGITVVTTPLDFIDGSESAGYDKNGITWVQATHTLTLSGAAVDIYQDADDAENLSTIIIPENGKIVILADSNIIDTYTGNKSEQFFAIYCLGKLDISGDKKLTIKTTANAGATAMGIAADAGLACEETKLDITSDFTAIKVSGDSANIIISGGSIVTNVAHINDDGLGYGIQADKGNVTINEGSVTTINGNRGIIAGYFGDGGNRIITISGGSVNVSGAQAGLWSSGDMIISGGVVNATAAGTSSNDCGINSQAGNIVISNGVVTANGEEYGIRAKAGNITISGNESIVTASGKTSAYSLSTAGIFKADGLVIVAGENQASAVKQTGDVKTAVTGAKYAKINFVQVVDDPDPSYNIPVSGDKGSTKNEVTVSGTKATVTEVTKEDLATVGTNDEVVINLTKIEDDVTGVNIPKTTFTNVAESNAKGLRIVMPEGTEVLLDKEALEGIASQAKGTNIRLVVKKADEAESTLTTEQKKTIEEMNDAVVLDAYFTSNGQRISDFKGGSAEVTAAYATTKPVRVWYVAEDGTKTLVPCTYDGKTATFTVTHFSHYVVEVVDEDAYTTCPKDETCVLNKYDDVIIDSWYHDGAHYCVENGIMLGTGNEFKPADTIIRAEVIQILYNMAGKPSTDFTMTFTDVAEGQWYTDAVRWAQSVGIAKGSNGKFKPTDAITREEFATMLYRFEQIVNGGGFTGMWVFPITGFDDVDMISGWADEAMHWMTMNQIVQGSNGKINPTGNASRADVATMVQRFCTLDK